MTLPPSKPPVPWIDSDESQIIPPRTSGVAIASCVLGAAALLIGWFPGCGSIPGVILAVVALVLAVVARRKARVQADANRVLPAVDLALGLLALLVSLVATGVLVADVIEARRNASASMRFPEDAVRESFEQQPSQIPGPQSIWRAVNGEGDATYGFLIEPSSEPGMPGMGIYAVTPTRGFGSEYAGHLAHPEPDGERNVEIPFGAMVWDTPEIRVLTVSTDYQGPPPFAYGGRLPMNEGDRVTLITPSETVEGEVTTLGSTTSAMVVKLDRPLQPPVPPAMPPTTQPSTESTAESGTRQETAPATGPTAEATLIPDLAVGCPVVLNATGTVVGVLIGALPEDETTVFAEHLLWPLTDVPAGPSGFPPAVPPAAAE